jgi:pyridoxine kinase
MENGIAVAKPAVIVVNSLVARGGVGGRASVFALERLGFPVWFVPTVTLSWHPGHGPATRLVPEAEGFDGMVGDLAELPQLDEVGAVLSGYVGAAGQAAAVARLVAAVQDRNPGAHYLCDSNIGDEAGLFVPEAVAVAIRDRLVPLADMATPNRHELAWLTGREAGDNDGLATAARALGVGEVVVTSAFAGEGEIGTLTVTGGDVRLVAHQLLDDVPNGTGDLFSALYLAARLNGRAAGDAAERAEAVVFAVARRAHDTGVDELPLAAAQSLFVV